MTLTLVFLREHSVGLAASGVLVLGMTSLVITSQLLQPAASPSRSNPSTLWAAGDPIPAHLHDQHTTPVSEALLAPISSCPQV